MIALVAMLTIAATGHAMSYEQARNEALFLTDKMAYELNLTDEQYEAAYEINLDYLMGVTSYDDVYATYWERRNLDMSYVLLEWQWQAFCAASYFYRPLYWDGGYWHFGIYARYPHRDYFYFGRPVFYASYRGGHAWHVIGGRGYYYGRREHFRPVAGRTHFGMLDRWNRGDFRNHHRYSGGGSRYNSGYRNSSTRYTVGNNRGNSYGRSLGNRRTTYENNRMYGSRPTTATEQRPSSRYSSSSSYGNRTNGSGSYHGSGSFGGSRNSGSFSGSHGSGSFTVLHSVEATAVVHLVEAAAAVHSAADTAAVHSAEAAAAVLSAEVTAAAEAARSEDIVKMRTSAFIIRWTSRIVHWA